MRIVLASAATLPLLGVSSTKLAVAQAGRDSGVSGSLVDNRPLWWQSPWRSAAKQRPREPMECVPSTVGDASSLRREADESEPDVGILTSAPYCRMCVQDPASTLGGYCADPMEAPPQSRPHEAEGVTGSDAVRSGRWLQSTSSSEGTFQLLIACRDADAAFRDVRCDCSRYPQTFSCRIVDDECYSIGMGQDEGTPTYTNVCFDQTIYVSQDDPSTDVVDVTYCTHLRTPNELQYCVTGRVQNLSLIDCHIEINGQECSSCSVGTCSAFDESIDVTHFDCSNTDMRSIVGNACDGDELFPLLSADRKYLEKQLDHGPAASESQATGRGSSYGSTSWLLLVGTWLGTLGADYV